MLCAAVACAWCSDAVRERWMVRCRLVDEWYGSLLRIASSLAPCVGIVAAAFPSSCVSVWGALASLVSTVPRSLRDFLSACVCVSVRSRCLASSIHRVVAIVVCRSFVLSSFSPAQEHGTLCCLVSAALSARCHGRPTPSIHPSTFLLHVHPIPRTLAPSFTCVVAAVVCVADAVTYTWSMLPREL
jgi:hypothetical protein